MGKVRVVVGGQFGSEAKGSVCAHLARTSDRMPLAAARVAGPNAGHTAYDDMGRAWAFRHIPVAAVIDPEAWLVIAAGSEVDFAVLSDEIHRCETGGFPVAHRLIVDQCATVLTVQNIEQEGALRIVGKIGSTGKGIGAARAARIMRTAPTIGQVARDQGPNGVLSLSAPDGSASYTVLTGDTQHWLNAWVERGHELHIEGTQGFGLGLHAGYYPTCTSSDCRAIDFLAMAGISPWNPSVDLEVWVTLRTFPIRVAGNSGKMHEELTWEQMQQIVPGVVPERTTVTQKIRRIGQWDERLAMEAMLANGAPSPRVRAALMFADYIDPLSSGATTWAELSTATKLWVDEHQKRINARFDLIGTSPTTIVDRRAGHTADLVGTEPML